MITRIFVCPWDVKYMKNLLFTSSFDTPPRGGKWPWEVVRAEMEKVGIEIATIDNYNGDPRDAAFIGIGRVFLRFPEFNSYSELAARHGFAKRILLSTEPPCISPNMFVGLDRFFSKFTNILYACKLSRTVFSHEKMTRLLSNKRIGEVEYFKSPVMLNHPLVPEFDQKRSKFLVMINGNKMPTLPYRELYSSRIAAVNFFGKKENFELYGKGWQRPTAYPAVLNPRAVRNCYRGMLQLGKKYEMLSQFNFAICFENCTIDGFITEKIFDCFYCGTVPIYFGAPDVTSYIPSSCFIDFRSFASFDQLHKYLLNLSQDDIIQFRKNITRFFDSKNFADYHSEAFARKLIDLVRN